MIKPKKRRKVKQAIIDFVEFEDATSVIYPWAMSVEDIISKHIEEITDECGKYEDSETVMAAVNKICGLNPTLLPSRKDLGLSS